VLRVIFYCFLPLLNHITIEFAELNRSTMKTTPQTRSGRYQPLLTMLVFLVSGIIYQTVSAAEKPHIVFVVGTTHYAPQVSMPVLAKEMERFGFRTTLIIPPGEPEENKNKVGIPGMEVLDEADVVVFFMRFLTLNDQQAAQIEKYVKSGKPVVALRTSTHSFNYDKGHPRFHWNDDFGEKVLGTAYRAHMSGKTKCEPIKKTQTHAVLTGVGEETFESGGSLYLTDLEAGCKPLVLGTGSSKSGVREGRFGTMFLQETETDILAWTWENNYGAKVFASSFGHVDDFGSPQIMRILVNGIHWAAGVTVPSPESKINTFVIEDPAHPRK